MAVTTYKHRLRRKNSAGDYDIYHLETEAGVVYRAGSTTTTVEASLTSLETTVSTIQTNITTINTNMGGLKGLASTAPANLASAAAVGTGDHAARADHVHAFPTQLSSSKTISLSGDVTCDGVAFNGSANITLNTTVADDSHNHSLATITGLLTDGKISTHLLPSYVDDVLEGYYDAGSTNADTTASLFYTDSGFTTANVIASESGKIYVDLTTNKTYRWSGTIYVVISETLALGTTDSTAYRGDYGAVAYAHALTGDGTPTNPTASATLTNSGTFAAITAMTFSRQHVASYTTTTYTMPAGYSHPSYSVTPTTSTPTQLAHGGTFTAITTITATTATNGHTTAYNTATYTLPAQYVHPTYAGTKTDKTASPAHGGTLVAVSAVTLSNGHVSAYDSTTYTLPAQYVHPSYSTTLGPTTGTAVTLDYGGKFTPVTVVARDATGHVSGYTTVEYTLPAAYTHPTYAGTKSSKTATLAYSGSFAAISAVTLTNGHITAYDSTTYTMPATYTHPTLTPTVTPGTPTPFGHNANFTAITSVTADSTGHLSAYTNTTYTHTGFDLSDSSSQPTTQNTGDFWLQAI